jgi:RHS repeat-associated protein
MPGRSSNSANPNDNYKFTGHELDDEAGVNLYHMNARGMDPVLGRMMQIDSRAEKYPGTSPYAYVLNSPVNFTDMTGDTVDISAVQKVYDDAVYGEGHKRAGERKDFADLTNKEKQAQYFFDYYESGGKEELAAYEIGGELESTNVTVSFATHSPYPKVLGVRVPLPFTYSGVAYGLTTFGLRNEDVAKHDRGHKDSTPRTSLSNIDFNIYLSPENVRSYEKTARHEMKHVLYITGQFLNGGVIKNAKYQHEKIIGY